MKKLLLLLFSVPLAAQTINPNQIRPSNNSGWVLTTPTANVPPVWAPIPAVPPAFDMQVIPPISGQYAVIYPTLGVLDSDPGNFSNISNDGSGYFKYGCTGLFCATQPYLRAHWVFPSLASYGITPANVTAIYFDTISSSTFFLNTFSNNNQITCDGGVSLTPSPYNSNPYPYQLVEQNGLSSLTGLTWSGPQCYVRIGPGSGGTGFYSSTGTIFQIPAIRAIVYYHTDPPQPTDNNMHLQPPLGLNQATNTLFLDESDLSAGHQFGFFISQLPAASVASNDYYWVKDGASTTDCSTGGGSNQHVCYSNGTSYTAVTGGGSVSSIATGQGLTGGPIVNSGTASCNDSTSLTLGCVKPDGSTVTTTGTTGVLSTVPTWQGAWNAKQSYSPGQIVTYSGSMYINTSATSSAGTFVNSQCYSGVVTFSYTVVGAGDQLVMSTSGTGTPTDTQGNTYVSIVSNTPTYPSSMWLVNSAISSGAMTVTAPRSPNSVVCMMEFTGLTGTANATVSANGVNSSYSPTITTTATSFIVAGFISGAEGFTSSTLNVTYSNGGPSSSIGGGYIKLNAGTYNPQMIANNPDNSSWVEAAFTVVDNNTAPNVDTAHWQALGGGGGGGVGGSGTTGYLPAWTAGTTLGNSHIDDGVTTASTLTAHEGLAVNDGSGNAGAVSLTQGTAVSNGTTAVTLTVPSSVTSYRIQLPGVQPSGSNTFLSCTAADPAVCSWAAASGGGSATVGSAEVVAFSATPTFSTAFNVSRIVLTGNITSFTMTGASDGQLKTLCFKQGAGPYTVSPPASVHGFFTIGTVNSDWNCQSFVWDNTDSIWQAVSTGTVNQ